MLLSTQLTKMDSRWWEASKLKSSVANGWLINQSYVLVGAKGREKNGAAIHSPKKKTERERRRRLN